MNVKGWHVITVCLLFIIIGFSIGKFTNKPADVIVPDYSIYERREDSLMSLYRLSQDSINISKSQTCQGSITTGTTTTDYYFIWINQIIIA